MSKPNSGLFSGTAGSNESLIAELERNNIKFSKEDIQFITRDNTGQIIWLETGNRNAGLTHIVNNHAEDFRRLCNVSNNDISIFLNKVFSNGKILYNGSEKAKPGLTRIIKYNENYFIQSGIGTNGFIISAYPISKKKAIKRLKKLTVQNK